MPGPGIVSKYAVLRLREYRLQRGWGTDLLEDRAGVGRGVVDKMEKGERGVNLTLDTAVLLAQALEVDINDVIYGEGNPRHIPPSPEMLRAVQERREKRREQQRARRAKAKAPAKVKGKKKPKARAKKKR